MKFLILFCIISATYAGPVKQISTNPYDLPASRHSQSNGGGGKFSESGNQFGRGANQVHPQQAGLTKDGYAKIIIQDQMLHHNGDYQYIYETDNGITAQEVGKSKIFDEENAGSEAQGQYSYTSPEGQKITVQYVANELGFQPVGDHIPTAPPVPDHVVRLLAYLAKHEQATEKSGKRF